MACSCDFESQSLCLAESHRRISSLTATNQTVLDSADLYYFCPPLIILLAKSPTFRHRLCDPRLQVRIVLDSGDQILTRDFERVEDDGQVLDPVVPFKEARVGGNREGNGGPEVAADPVAKCSPGSVSLPPFFLGKAMSSHSAARRGQTTYQG